MVSRNGVNNGRSPQNLIDFSHPLYVADLTRCTSVNDRSPFPPPPSSAELTRPMMVRVPSAKIMCGRSLLARHMVVPSVKFTMLLYARPL
jgi:hypothetical protein